MQYWINQNGVQTGPHTREDLEKMNVSADAYVWRSGLDDWVKISSLTELDGVVGSPSQEETVAAEAPSEPEQVQTPVQEPEDVEAPQIPQPHPVVAPPIPEVPQQPQYVQPQYAQQPLPKRPPTNMAWAIICTIMCCTIPGIVAIVYATKVSRRYAMGDYEGAERASETGAWWCIGSIIAGLALSPLFSIFRMLIFM